MEIFLSDLRFAIRLLAKSSRLSAIAILTLAIGVGANTAIFSFVDSLWLRAIPVPDRYNLVRVYTSGSTADLHVARDVSSYPDFLDLQTQATSFESIAAVESRGALLKAGTETLACRAMVVSENFFSLMRPQVQLGRLFTQYDADAGTHAVLLSDGFWRRQFHGEASVVGRTIIVDNQEVVVLGVLPRGFTTADSPAPPDLWVPMSTWNYLVGDQRRLEQRGRRTFEIYGRLKPGVELDRAAAELQSFSARLAQTYPQTNADRSMSVEAEADSHGESNRRVGSLLLLVGGCVLLIACANVSSLLLARAEGRRKELATRMALGGTRGRLARQLLTESVLLTVIALAAAIVSADWLLHLLRSMMPLSVFPAGAEAQIDARALVFALIAATLCLLVFGAIAAFQSNEWNLVEALRESAYPKGRNARVRSAIIVGQIGLSLAIVACAGLLVRTVIRAQSVRPGFETSRNLLIMEVIPSFVRHSDADLRAYLQSARRALEEVPGVTGTAAALRVPFDETGSARKVLLFTDAELANTNSQGLPILMTMVSDGYFETLGTRLLRGRSFDRNDIERQSKVLVINQSLARMLWPNQDAVGKHLRLHQRTGPSYEIIGIAEDGKYREVTEDSGPYVFMPLTDELGEYELVASTAPDAATLASAARAKLRGVDPAVPILHTRTLREHIQKATFDKRMAARLVAVLGSLAVMLAAVGVYGLISFFVSSRTRDIGIRMAMGATPHSIFQLVLGRAARLAAIGIVIGLAAGTLLARGIEGLLFSVAPLDPISFLSAAAILAVTALFAAAIPAYRATKVDVIQTLHYE